MKIIAINAGSSSLKFSLINMDDESVIASGVFDLKELVLMVNTQLNLMVKNIQKMFL